MKLRKIVNQHLKHLTKKLIKIKYNRNLRLMNKVQSIKSMRIWWMRRSWTAKMTMMLSITTKMAPESQARRDPRRPKQVEEAMEEARTARTRALELVSAHQTSRATLKTNLKTILRKSNSCRESLEPVALEKSFHNLSKCQTKSRRTRTKTPSHAIAQQAHPRIARLERTPPATIRLQTPSPTQVASFKSDQAAMRPILKISRDNQAKMAT